MRKTLLYLTLLLGLCPMLTQAQLTGRITDVKGEPIPFTNVYVENTSNGTNANADGYYTFDIKGSQKVVFQSLGYKKRVETVEISGKTTLDIQLVAADFELAEVVVKANAEDPAYPIIRQAIKLRTTYRNQVSSYSYDAYIKGVQKALNAPKKIFGRDIGDMGGNLDTLTRQGILYLSETLSKVYVDNGKMREELKSVKVSGNDNGFGFNRATAFDFNFYDNTINIFREILSPIADNALNYYRYKLLGQFKDPQGNTVYRIEVIPKRKEDPTWSGDLYIVDNQYNIYQTDLFVTGKSIQQNVLDTLYLRQTFVPIKSDKEVIWRLLSQNMEFQFGLFGFKIGGKFHGVFSNYNLTPQYNKGFFTNEIFKAAKGENDNNLSYWDTIRPIPLTLDENRDYVRKDSIQKIRQSQPYLDSVDRRRNRFKPFDLLTGYTYRNAWERWSLGFESPLTTLQFNPVQGFALSVPFNYTKRFGERFKPYTSEITATPSVSYGFSERKIRADAKVSYQFNRFNDATLTIEGGQKLAQFNENAPIAVFLAQLYMLYDKRNFMPLFEKTYAKIGYEQEIVNGLRANLSVEYADRRAVNTNSQYSFRKKDQAYNPNTPLSNFAWENHKALISSFSLSWTPNQKYSTYPQFKSIEGSKYPTLSARIQNITVGSDNWQKLNLSIAEEQMMMGIAGYLQWNIGYGAFFSSNNARSQFIDYQHFIGNETFVANPKNYLGGYFQLPFYQYSTRNSFLSAHAEHHFEGYIFDKIPLLRKLQLKEVVRVAYLRTPELGDYAEVGFGIENIGIKLIRPLRVDLSWRFQDGKLHPTPKLMIGLNL
jgi:Family of unknown function (DUF5686)/CarboxypepD_reg-like domain